MTRNGTVKIIIVAMLVLSGAGFGSVSHAALKTWSSPGPDSLWSTPGNWTPPGVPTNTDSVVFEGTSSVNCRNVFGAVYAMTLATGYSGTVTIGMSMNLSTEPGGNLTIGSGTFKGTDGHLTVGGNVVITGGTFTIPDQSRNFLVGGGWNKTGGTVTWDATAKVKFVATTPGHIINLGTPGGTSDMHALCFDGSGGGWTITSDISTDSIWFERGSLNLGAGRTINTYVFNCTSNQGALAFGSSSTLNIAGNMARFEVASIDHGTGTLAFTGATGVQGLYSSTDTLPNIVHSGASTLQLEGANSLRCKSFSNTAGHLALNFNDITTFGDFRVVGGNSSTFVPATLNSRKFYIRGKALFQGSASSLLNFNATPYCSLKVADTLIADYASVSGIFPTTDSTMGGLYKGMAAITSRDDGNNGTGWVFPFSRITSTLLDSLKDGCAALYFDIDNNGQLDLFTSGFNKSPYTRRSKIVWDSSFNTSISFADSLNNVAVAAADYDNDSDIDFAMNGSNVSGPVGSIYRNNGAGSFTKVLSIQGTYWGSLDWGDYDIDGDLDLLVAGNTNSSGFCSIYRNDGNDNFTQQSSSFPAIKKGTARFGDYNNDGLPDVLVSGENYAGSTRYTKIFRNFGTYFSDEYAALPQAAGPSNWVDYDSDGDLDVFINGYDGSAWMARLYQNSSGSFTHVSSAAFTPMYLGAQVWTDFNGDGKPDLAMSGQLASGGDTVTVLYRNNANGTFTDLQAALPGLAGGALAWGDVNSDSTPDLYMTGALKGGNGSAFPQILKNNLKIITGFVKPTVPTGLTATVMKDTILFSWGSSTTSFGPATYNLRAGTVTKMDSLISGMVTGNSGLMAQAGNSGFTTSRKVRARLGSGWYKFQVQAVDNRLVRSAFSAPESIYVDTTPPTVNSAALTQPNGGQVLGAGSSYSIYWSSGAIADNYMLKNNPVTLQYSSDSLVNFTTIISNISNSGSYGGTVPNVNSTKMFIRLIATDSAGNVAYDTSDTKFSIDAVPPLVTSNFITRPNGGEIIRTMVNDTIRWNNAAITESKLKNPGPLNIQLSTNGGTTWSNTINAAYDTAGGKFAWMPTGAYAGTTLRIRIGVSDSAGNVAWDTSNANFTLDHNWPTVSASTILKPNGGEIVRGSNATTILWDTAAITDNVKLRNLPIKLDYSLDNGTTFPYSIVTATANSGSYSWTVPDTIHTTVRVRLTATDSAGMAAYDTSNASFKIDNKIPKVLSNAIDLPNGGQKWLAGTVQQIYWMQSAISDSIGLKNKPVTLQYSTDDFATFNTIKADTALSPASFNWTLPVITSNTVKVRIMITDSAGFVAYDTSNAYFKIDGTKPIASVTTPANKSFVSAPTSFSGTATDSGSGVKNIFLSIKRMSDNYYCSKDVNGVFAVAVQLMPCNFTGSSWALNFTNTPFAEGSYIAAVFAIDSSSDTGIATYDTFTVDLTPPAVTVTSPANNLYTKVLPAISGTATDAAGSGISMISVALRNMNDTTLYWGNSNNWSVGFQGHTATGTTSWTETNWGSPQLASGVRYGLYIQGIDAIGNTTPISTPTVQFTYDTTKPVVSASTITFPNGSEALAGGSTQTISWNSGMITDNTMLKNSPVKLELVTAGNDSVISQIIAGYINSGAYAAWSVPVVDGSYKIKLTAIDSAVNSQVDYSNAAFTISSTAPSSGSITITDNNGYTNDSVPLVTISASNADSMRLTLDTTLTVVWQTYAVSKTVAIERGGDGTKRVWAQFKDRAGNRSIWVSDATVLDRVAPAALPVMSSIYNEINWKDTLIGTVADERSGVARVSVMITRLSDNAHWDTKNNYWIPQMQEYAATGIASWNTVIEAIALTDGQYMVSAYATDNAGNVQRVPSSATFEYYEMPQARYVVASALAGAAPFRVTLMDSSRGTIDNRIYAWGDGRYDTVKTQSGALQHIYANKGSYTAGLVVSGPGGSDTLVNSNYVIVSDTTRPVNPNNIRTIALSSSTAKISWSPVAISDIKDVAICFSTKGTWQNGDSITAAVADTAQGLILVKYVDVKKIVDTIINLPDYGVRLYVSAFARDSSGNLALFDNTAADTIVLPDGRAPQNTITATLTNKGDSTVTVKFVTSKTIATDAVRIDAYASTGALSIDSASPLLSFFKHLSYKDSAFSVRVIDKPGTWYFAYVLVDSNGNKTSAYVDTQKIANMAPAFVAHPDVTIKQSLSYVDSVQAADRNGDGLVYRLLTAPKEMAIATASRTIVWSLTQKMSVGSNQIVVECTDGRGGVALDTFIVNVIPANELPRTYLKQKQQAYGALSYRIGAQDLNDSIFTYTDTLFWIDSNKSVTPTVSSAGVFTYYPLMDGTYRFSCRAQDAKGARDSMLYVDTARISGATKRLFADTAAWHMLSVPAMTAAVFADSLKLDGALMHWDETGNERNLYQYYSSANQTVPGKAYWRKASRTAPVQLTRSQLVRDTAVTIALAKGAYGWNQIASPYVYPVKVTGVPNLWKWNADSADYMLAGNAVLEPWQGYWAMVDTARIVVIPATPVYNGVSMLAKRQMPYFTSRSEWQVRFSLQLPGGVDGENRIGFSRSARNGFDALDLCEPPRPDGKSSAFIYHPEWKVGDGRFASDIRIDWEEINVFQIGIAPGSQNANLSFSGVGGLSGIYMYILNGDSLMRLDDKISVAVNTGSEMLYKTVFASSRSDLQATLPMVFVMHSPMPNPVRQSARIGYTLPYTWAANGLLTARAYDVSMRIYDVSGRIVRDMVSRRQDAGTYSVIWDGKSNNGRFIAAGNYYCRIVAGKYTAIKNVIVVR